MTYGVRECDDALDLFRLGQIGGVEEDCVLRLHGLRRVLRIPLHEDVGLFGDFVVRWAPGQALRESSARALPALPTKSATPISRR